MRRRSRRDIRRAARATRLQHRARKPVQPQPARQRSPACGRPSRVALAGPGALAAMAALVLGAAAEPGEET